MIPIPTQTPTPPQSVASPCFFERADLHRLTLRLYDVDAQIVSDSGRHLRHIRNLFHRFIIEPESAQDPCRFLFLTGSDNPWESPVFIVDDQTWPLQEPIPPEEYIYTRILSAIVSRIQSHMMIHAGMVAHGHSGLMIVADSYHGKTTLVLELVRRGFRYLSDDMAAFDRANRLVHPFPLRIGMRPGTWSLVMGDATLPKPPNSSEKTLLDCEDIRRGSLGSPVACQQVVFLHSPLAAQRAETERTIQTSIVVVDRIHDDLLCAIKAIDGIRGLAVEVDNGITVLTLRSKNTTSVLAKVEAACEAHQVLLLYIRKEVEKRPTFEGPACLSPISKREAVLGLLKKFQGGYTSHVLQKTFNDNPARLLMALTSIVEPAACYQLSVGPLGDMTDHLCRLMDVELV